MKIKKRLLLAIASFVVLGVQSSYAAHKLRVGIYYKDVNRKLILIGIESGRNPAFADLDFSSIGFSGKGMDHIDPKFLLEVDADGIKKVHSFDLAAKGTGLPPLLLDVAHAKRDENFHFTGNVFSFLGKSLGFPIATGTALGGLPKKNKENLKKLNAYYLMEIVNKALPPFDHFPELKEALSPDPLKAEELLRMLGEALLTRFNPKSNWAGIHVPGEEKGSFYEQWRQIQAGDRVKDKGYLVRYANEAGLEIASMGDDFAIVLVDANPYLDKSQISKEDYHEKFRGLGSDQSGPREVIHHARIDYSKGLLIPWYLVSFVNPSAPTDLVNFIFPWKVGKNLHRYAMTEFGLDLGGSVIPFSNLLMHGIYKGIKTSQFNHGNTEYLKRLESYGVTLALAETQLYSPPILGGIAYEQFRSAVESLSVSLDFDNTPHSDLLNQVVYLLASEEVRIGSLLKAPNLEEKRSAKTVYFNLIKESLRDSKISRSPSGGPSKPVYSDREPIILFLIDGLRPDRFNQAVRDGYFPHLKRYFFDRGVQLESYTSRSLTLPSWATVFTGFETDFHGIRSNSPFSRVKQKMTENYLNQWKDVFSFKNHHKNRAFQKLEVDQVGEEGKVWFPGYFNQEEKHLNYLPIVNGPSYPIKKLLGDYFGNYSHYANDIRFHASALDIASAGQAVKAIHNDKKGQLRLVMNWYASVDHACHVNNRLLPTVYRELDEAIGSILEAAQNHPVLKDATVFLVSDHGHSAGYGPFDKTSTIYEMDEPSEHVTGGPLLANTAFNLTHFFGGKYSEFTDYGFEVGAIQDSETQLDLGLMEEFQVPSFKYIQPKQHLNATALVDYAGDNLAQIYIIQNSNPSHRPNFYELSHFIGVQEDRTLNIPFDLLNAQIANIRVTDEGLAERIEDLSDHTPIRLFAMPLKGKETQELADAFGATPETGASSRDPILVLAKREGSFDYRAALILTRDAPDGQTQFRYVVLKKFLQNSKGQISGQISADPEDDPLEYMGQVMQGEDSFSHWHTDREWLKMSHLHKNPTAIFFLARALTLSPRYTDPNAHLLSDQVKEDRQAEVPDFLLIANPGFSFGAASPQESDHGGLLREEVKNCFFVSSINQEKYKKHVHLSDALILNRDFMPTILNFAGMGEKNHDPLPKTQGESFKKVINAYLSSP